MNFFQVELPPTSSNLGWLMEEAIHLAEHTWTTEMIGTIGWEGQVVIMEMLITEAHNFLELAYHI